MTPDESLRQFWTERRLASLTTVRPNGTPHVVAVGVTVDFEQGIARVIASGTSYKARLIRAAGDAGLAAAVCQFEGRTWSTMEGRIRLLDDAASVRDAEERYAQRYRQPRENPQRVVLELTIGRVLGNA
ncbi:acyltransferase [Amycolatopsis sp. AA4]|uniref:pyridoxamine 5'-phosphate oxidase family protein n=1 Tax=Actinomycetes TaxID=1760 RepID=UPI0001B54A6D|nr:MULTISPECIES: pyridoxamine 5'-phosphate oxidase family protein [Actinomycetes]ATY10059.1 acyltransferase [Amycolatopsis sp. AA4]EFL05495.1 nitrilase/cyanide hydratase and apolipoprotein N-acyltransferase [Streptomyces sp. AA4]